MSSVSLENNAAERLVKFHAIGRKNYLFVGNERAGRNAARPIRIANGRSMQSAARSAAVRNFVNANSETKKIKVAPRPLSRCGWSDAHLFELAQPFNVGQLHDAKALAPPPPGHYMMDTWMSNGPKILWQKKPK
jgi:hypothetical protein